MESEIVPMEKCENQIVLFESSDKVVTLDVTIDKETVWLTQLQMAILFDVSRSVVTRHISNVFREKEADEKSNVHFLHIANSDKPVKQYSLDIIISVGYRVKSKRGIEFRKWANSVLKEFLLKGYSVNQRLELLEQHQLTTDKKIDEIFNRIEKHLPSSQGIFFDGQVFDAYSFISDLIRTAADKIILIDNYIDESVLTLLDKRGIGVTAEIYTHSPNAQLQLDIQRHDSQYTPIPIHVFTHSHDRFLCIDDTVYHIGASLKDLGKKWFAFSRMEINTESLLEKM